MHVKLLVTTCDIARHIRTRLTSSNALECSQVKHTLLTMGLHLTNGRSFGFLSALYGNT